MKKIKLTFLACLISGLFASASYASVPPDDLVGYWTFDEASGNTTFDSSSYGNDGTLSGGSRQAGLYGNALALTGSGGTTIANSSSLQSFGSGLTMEAWINPTQYGDFTSVFYKTNKDTREFMHFQTGNNAGNLHIGINTDPYTWTTPDVVLIQNEWQHVAWTYDMSFNRIYVNGKEVFNTPYTDPVTGNTENLLIGQNAYIAGSNFVGFIDEARIYNYARTPEQIGLDMVTVTPEPASMALFGLGAGALAFARRRKKLGN